MQHEIAVTHAAVTHADEDVLVSVPCVTGLWSQRSTKPEAL